jgi:hypothetical protein
VHFHRPFNSAAANFLDQLIDTNASRIQGDVEERVVQSRLLLEAEVRRLLSEVRTTAERALASARLLLDAGSTAVEHEFARPTLCTKRSSAWDLHDVTRRGPCLWSKTGPGRAQGRAQGTPLPHPPRKLGVYCTVCL